MKLLNKISVKTVYGKVVARDLSQDQANPTPIMEVFGRAGSVKKGQSDMGPWVAFLGVFEATSLGGKTQGEIYNGFKFFCPSAAFAEAIQGQLESKPGTPVEFGIKIGAYYDDTAAAKYVYTVESMLKREQALLADLRAEAKGPTEPETQAAVRPVDFASAATGTKKRARSK